MKLGVEDERMGLLVADELIFNGEPDATRGSARRHDVAEEIGGDGGVHPGAHDTLHGVPVAGVLQHDVEIDVIIKGILTRGVEEEVVPLVVLCRVAIKDDGHQSTEVLDRDGLSVERGGEDLCIGDASARSAWRARSSSTSAAAFSRRSLVCSASVSTMTNRWWWRQLGITAEERSQERRIGYHKSKIISRNHAIL
jgi:hypothetical protein